MVDVAKAFDKHRMEHGKFDRITNKLSSRPDIHAFLLLDSLLATQAKTKMVAAADHDKIILAVSLDDLAKSVCTEDDVRDLCRCGVWCDRCEDCLSMFV
jgi:hypothetical protein